MNKLFSIFLITGMAFAHHRFTICYHDQSDVPLSYKNNVKVNNWKNLGEFIGEGKVDPGETKCFKNLVDENFISSHSVKFEVTIANISHELALVNSWFSRPYLAMDDANNTDKKKSRLKADKSSGEDEFNLHVFINKDKTLTFSNSDDLSKSQDIIEPRRSLD